MFLAGCAISKRLLTHSLLRPILNELIKRSLPKRKVYITKPAHVQCNASQLVDNGCAADYMPAYFPTIYSCCLFIGDDGASSNRGCSRQHKLPYHRNILAVAAAQVGHVMQSVFVAVIKEWYATSHPFDVRQKDESSVQINVRMQWLEMSLEISSADWEEDL